MRSESRFRRACGAHATVGALLLIAIGCGGSSPTAPGTSVPFAQTDLRVGTGTETTTGKVLTVNYAGWLYSAAGVDQKGQLFDTSVSAGRTPFSFTLGAGQVIRGWDQGFPGMRIGGVRRLVIPPDLAYGASGSGSIPPNATLVFEIELLAVQ